MRIKDTVRNIEEGIEKNITYCDFPLNTGLGYVHAKYHRKDQ